MRVRPVVKYQTAPRQIGALAQTACEGVGIVLEHRPGPSSELDLLEHGGHLRAGTRHRHSLQTRRERPLQTRTFVRKLAARDVDDRNTCIGVMPNSTSRRETPARWVRPHKPAHIGAGMRSSRRHDSLLKRTRRGEPRALAGALPDAVSGDRDRSSRRQLWARTRHVDHLRRSGPPRARDQ